MDRSPFDIEMLGRMANELFRDAAPVAPAAGTPAIPAASAAPLVAGPGTDPATIGAAAMGAGNVHPIDLGLPDPDGIGPVPPPAGGATFSRAAPPGGPALGRPVPADVPTTPFGTGQPYLGTTTGADAGSVAAAFDPRSLPGFAPIPNVEDGFDVALLGLTGDGPSLQGFGLPSDVPGEPHAASLSSRSPMAYAGADPIGRAPASDPTHPLPMGSGAAPDVGRYPTRPLSVGRPVAGGATLSPSSPPTRPSLGRPLPDGAPTIGYGTGQPLIGTAPLAGAAGAPSFGFDLAGLEAALASVEDAASSPAPGIPHVPGLAAAPGSATARSAPAPARKGPGMSGPQPEPRSIDRPTPTGFQFTDAPHLGEFPEEAILRARIDPQPVPGLSEDARTVAAGDLGGLTLPAYPFDDGMDYFANDVPDLPRPTATPFNADAVRRDFPILNQRVNGYPLVWLDNGATTQKPQAVIDRLSSFYENENSNINRSAHELAARASDAYEDARRTVQRFINAPSIDELVFVRGTTEGINFVAQSFGRRFVKAGDEIVLTHAEHHANIVPWYLLAKEVGATLRVAPFDDQGEILLDEYDKLLSDRVRIVAMSHVSNALGTILPVKAMTEMAHRHGIPVLVDGAQSISHMPIDVQDIDCDFFVFSGHKVFAPTGIGAVYGKKALLDQMPPWQGGGNMIKDVTFEKITFQPAPGRFEAGTGNIADAVGLGEAFKYLERFGMTNIALHEHALLDYATQRLAAIKGLKIIGRAKEKAGVISFLLDGKEPVEVGKALDQKGIAVRAGHHCALPILRRYGVEATVRPAFAMYNTFEDADRLAEAVREIAAN